MASVDQRNATFNAPLKSVVILARERYGDVIMLTPLIAALKQQHPSAAIYIVAFTKMVFDFFIHDDNIAGVFHAKRDLARYILRFLPRKYDLLFNSKDHKSTHFLLQSRLIRARFKVGYRNNGNESLFDRLLEVPRGTHESQRNLELLQAIGESTPQAAKPYIPVMPVSAEIDALIGMMPVNRYIGINISAGTPGGNRTFEQWSDLIRSFPDERFVIFSSPADLEAKQALERPHPNVITSPSTKNLYEVWKLLDRLKLLVTPDTSLVHVAACSDKPVVALYRHNPDDSRLFAPLSTLQEVITSPTQEVMDIDDAKVREALCSMLVKLSASS